jgi:hypothetical protein
MAPGLGEKIDVSATKSRHFFVCMNIEQETIIKCLRFKGHKVKYIISELGKVYEQEAYKLQPIQQWMHELACRITTFSNI